MALFLRNEDITETVTMDAMLETIEDMQSRYGYGEASNLGRQHVISGSSLLAVMGGGVHHEGVFGVKTYTAIGSAYSFHVALYDTATGNLLAFLQADRLGQLRTGATTGVAAKFLARTDAGVMGILGTGYQAPTQVEAVSKVRKIHKVKAYSRAHERCKRFAQDVSLSLDMDVVPVESSKEAVEGSDVVVCITNSMEPVLDGGWLDPGALLVSAGPVTWRAREVDDASIQRASKIVVDSLEQAPIEAGELASAVDRGLIQWSQLVELRHVVAGVIPGRRSSDENIYAKLMGTGIADVAAAKLAYDRARARGMGTEMEF